MLNPNAYSEYSPKPKVTLVCLTQHAGMRPYRVYTERQYIPRDSIYRETVYTERQYIPRDSIYQCLSRSPVPWESEASYIV
jgi:hypothetical protein